MLLTKKIKFSVNEAQIKEDIFSDGSDLLLKINLKYPDIRCGKNDPLNKYAAEFYKKLAFGLADFARGELLTAAKISYGSHKDGFLPFAAVMKYEVTFESNEYLSILSDISVCDGLSTPSVERKTQVWDRKSGLLCRCGDFLPKSNLLEMTDENGCKIKNRELFVLRENRIEIFVPNGKTYCSVYKNIEIHR